MWYFMTQMMNAAATIHPLGDENSVTAVDGTTNATFDTLTDEISAILAYLRFADLLHLKCVSKTLCVAVRRVLTSVRFKLASQIDKTLRKQYCEMQEVHDIKARFVKVLKDDDLDNLEALLHLNLMSPSIPLTALGHSSPNGVLPLHMAHSAETVRLLVDVYGAVVDERRANGKTALMDACTAGEAEVVIALCERGADVRARCADGVSCLRYAEMRKDGVENAIWNWRGRGPSRTLPDGTACAQALYTFGLPRDGAATTRSDWFHASESCDMPDEYMPAFH